ncbi:isoleucine--tRNA ligase [Candidatus Marinamargulisbacteria bacterium SCGC AG-333-B06]|nr:isoleucine--tRNA ligase [Candidatus Marinamargulisbacteria bacterium SCGC AG-333-B06]
MTTNQDKKLNLQKTVNLPKTSFPMRANLAQNEPQSIKRWKKQKLYQQLLEKLSDKPAFIFHDGPPYANGNIHLGHLLNKVLKDFVVRSQHTLGNLCSYTPGWDCHGLPIEHKVMESLTESGNIQRIIDLPLDHQKMAIRNECCAFAKKHIKCQSNQMQSLLTLADYDKPYLTMSKSFESATMTVFSKLIAEGIVYRQLKPVHWSIANQTALADAELDYYDKIDTSIYTSFPVSNTKTNQDILEMDCSSVSFLIWTTTPWTLPANRAIAIHDQLDYSLVLINEHHYIVATNCLPLIQEHYSFTYTTKQTITANQLVSLTYDHPFMDLTNPIITGDFVTDDDGTGLVHIAPGHGTDDYLASLEAGIDVYCPVQADGTYDNTVPDWIAGHSIWDANAIIIDKLKSTHNLFYAYEFNHSYPHDWRSKTPVIFRATEQWFISVDKPLQSSQKSLRDLALAAIDHDIEFVPNWGQNRLRGMLESRPDWCISRQRSWGLPIPAFKSGKTILLTQQSTQHIATIFEAEGSDAWFKQSAQDLLAGYDPNQDPNCPESFDKNNAEKLYDIFDVWFESGSSWQAVMQTQHGNQPVDLYLEGSDQHRGWFHLSLLACLGVHQRAPYKQLLTHGFIVDKEGRKMSKSMGNTLDVSDILKQYGAEVTRWWVSSLNYENDIKVDVSFFDTASETYRKIRNTIRFLLSNLSGYTILSKDAIQADFQNLFPNHSIESYVLGKLSEYEQAIHSAYQGFQFKQANQLIYECCTELLSSFYCAITKDTLYCDALQSAKRYRIQVAYQLIIEKLLRLIYPILPHTSDEAYQSLYQDPSLCIALADSFDISVDVTLADWHDLFDARQDAQKRLEAYKDKGIDNTLDAGLKLPQTLEKFQSDTCQLADIFGVSRVEFQANDTIEIMDLRQEPRCERSWKRDETVALRSNGMYLSDRDFHVIKELL